MSVGRRGVIRLIPIAWSIRRFAVRAAKRALSGCVAGGLAGAALLASAERGRAEEAPVPAGYVGDAACETCHAESRHVWAGTIHARVFAVEIAEKALTARGCEGCHGPGEHHVRDPGGEPDASGFLAFGSSAPAAIRRENEVCLDCHRGAQQRLWTGSPHDSRDVGCVSCHRVKQPATARGLLAASDQTTLCGTCHPAARAQQLRNRHMPTRTGIAGAGGEGFMDCGSCHEPHGTVGEALVAGHTINESCYACHAEKRGPFLWEHAPVNENCLNCHEAHGSIRPGMLKRSSARLCQTCHIESSHPSQNRGPTDRFTLGQNCLHCHSRIHGSNHPSGSFFTR